MKGSCRVLGCAGYLPARVLSNLELSQKVDTSSEWIVSRTGIESRRVADKFQLTSHLAIEAAKSAMASARVDSVDLIILATTTPDNTFPSTSCRLQAALELKSFVPAFDLQAVCCGFIYALEVASKFLSSGSYQKALLVCADKMSSIIDWNDRSTCVLFGDGAGALVLGTSKEGTLDTFIAADGNFYDALSTTGGACSSELVGKVKMDGKLVFRYAVERMSESVSLILERNKLSIDSIDWFVPHQANSRIMSAVAKNIGISQARVISTVAEHANCGGASIPLALWEGVSKGKVKEGDLILMAAFGAGFTWGSAVLRW